MAAAELAWLALLPAPVCIFGRVHVLGARTMCCVHTQQGMGVFPLSSCSRHRHGMLVKVCDMPGLGCDGVSEAAGSTCQAVMVV